MTDAEIIEWRKKVCKMAQPIMDELDKACPYYSVVVTPRGATLAIDEHHVHNPKYDPRKSTDGENV